MFYKNVVLYIDVFGKQNTIFTRRGCVLGLSNEKLIGKWNRLDTRFGIVRFYEFREDGSLITNDFTEDGELLEGSYKTYKQSLIISVHKASGVSLIGDKRYTISDCGLTLYQLGTPEIVYIKEA